MRWEDEFPTLTLMLYDKLINLKKDLLFNLEFIISINFLWFINRKIVVTSIIKKFKILWSSEVILSSNKVLGRTFERLIFFLLIFGDKFFIYSRHNKIEKNVWSIVRINTFFYP